MYLFWWAFPAPDQIWWYNTYYFGGRLQSGTRSLGGNIIPPPYPMRLLFCSFICISIFGCFSYCGSLHFHFPNSCFHCQAYLGKFGLKIFSNNKSIAKVCKGKSSLICQTNMCVNKCMCIIEQL